MSVLIKGMKMPANCLDCELNAWDDDLKLYICPFISGRQGNCPLVEIPLKHGRLVDIDELSKKMYHDAFETDTELQKWEGGCWIRYKMFEKNRDKATTVIEAED